MLLADEHELGGGEALNIGQVDMDEHEDDEHVHAEVVDDAHGHETAHEVRRRGERGNVHGHAPQAEPRPEHQHDEDRDLLRHAELGAQGMILLQEQVVLDPLQGLMTVVLLGQPGLEVGHLLARAAGRRGLHEEGHDDAGHTVDEQHETEEQMAAAGDAREERQHREVDDDARQDEHDHGDQVDPVGHHEDKRMGLFVVSEMGHLTSPPKGW